MFQVSSYSLLLVSATEEKILFEVEHDKLVFVSSTVYFCSKDKIKMKQHSNIPGTLVFFSVIENGKHFKKSLRILNEGFNIPQVV
jgi:hypothetical protein